MTSIEERVVSMKFDNGQFEASAKTTLATLEALNKGLKMEGATKGLGDLHKAGQNVQLGHIATAVDNIASRFHAMSAVALTALATITHKAVEAGLSITRSLTIDPLKTGFSEYETNLNSIQTILANTQAAGTTLDQVNAALAELNLYSDQTIYNFAEMARNIGTFTAAGVALEPATAAIKGIANLAALSGSNSQQAATAMYQLSQALSTGTVRLMDWNSVVNAGMGGTVFQRALAQTAVVMGTLNEEAVTLDGAMQTVKISGDSFRNSLEQGWLTADVLSTTLAQFTGDLTDAELAALGFSQTQIEAIQKQAQVARAAATEVKTMTQLLGALRESAGSGWAQTWQIIFGNFEEAKELWSGVYAVLDGIIGNASRARNELLAEWKELGGRDNLFAGIANVFEAFSAVLKPITDAFQEIFPPATAEQLVALSQSFEEFTEKLMPSREVLEQIGRIASGVFSVLGIGWDILQQVGRVLGDLLGLIFEGSGGFLEFAASIGDFLTELRVAINEGDGFVRVFDNIGRILAVPVEMLKIFGEALEDVFGGVDTESAAEGLVAFADGINPLGGMADFIVNAWGKVLSLFDEIWQAMSPLADKFSEWFGKISDAVGGLDFESLLNLINTGTFAALVVVIRNSLGRGGISGVIDEFTDALGAMQFALNAAAILQIAIAIGILAASAVALSTVNSEQLAASLSAMAIMFTQLLAATAIMARMPNVNVVKMYATAAALTVLAIAVNLLAIAVKQLSDLSWEELLKGLVGTTVLLGALVAAANFMPDSARMISTGIGLTILAAGILILVQAVQGLSGLSWEEMARGLTGVGALLAALTLFTRFAQANATGVLAGAGIVLLATGIKILASAIIDLSGVSWENIGKGVATLAASLALITAALMLIPPTAPLSAAAVAIVAASILILAQAIEQISGISWENFGKGMAVIGGSLLLITAALVVLSNFAPTAIASAAAIFVVALAVKILAEAIAEMGGMSWDEIIRGLVALAGTMLIIVVALNAMQASIAGAAALLIVSAALVVLSAVLKTLGGMTWDEIVRGLVALAAAFTIIGLAALLLQPVIPAMIGLGLAIALIGAGLALAGAGVFLFAAGLTALSVAGAAGAAAIVAILSAVIGLIPTIVEQIGVGILILLDILIEAVPKIVTLIIDLLLQLIQGLDQLLPALGELILKLIALILTILVEAIPDIQQAGIDVLLALLRGIRDNIGKVVDLVGDIIQEFLRALGKEIPEIVDAGFDMLISFMEGITKAVEDNAEEMGEAGADMAWAIIEGVVRGLGSFGWRIRDKLLGLAKDAWSAALDFLGINSPSTEAIWASEMLGAGLVIGLERSSKIVDRAAEGVAESALDSLRSSLSKIQDLTMSNINLSPTITPVLDLSDVRNRANELAGLLSTTPISVDTSYFAARAAEIGYQQAREDMASEVGPTESNTYTFNQYNTSPRALSTADIYRQTKNQISTARGVLP